MRTRQFSTWHRGTPNNEFELLQGFVNCYDSKTLLHEVHAYHIFVCTELPVSKMLLYNINLLK
jgi:hypothetical protein